MSFPFALLFSARAVTSIGAKSQSLPFLEAPPNCEGYVGNVGFDPFRFSDFAPVDFLREAELKHGRICMMAWLGYVSVDLGFRVLPIPEGLEGLTAATAHDAAVEQGGMAQLLLWFSLAEVIDGIAINQMLEGSGRAPGDFGWDGGMLKGKSDEYIEDMKLKEITHCRLAMLAFSGVITQSVLTSGPFPYVCEYAIIVIFILSSSTFTTHIMALTSYTFTYAQKCKHECYHVRRSDCCQCSLICTPLGSCNDPTRHLTLKQSIRSTLGYQ